METLDTSVVYASVAVVTASMGLVAGQQGVYLAVTGALCYAGGLAVAYYAKVKG